MRLAMRPPPTRGRVLKQGMAPQLRGVVLAGGTGSRLWPLTRVVNKHLLPVGRKPMVQHAVEKLVDAGITEICVVTGVEHVGDLVNQLGSGREHGCDFTYRVQDEAGGIAQALGLTRAFARGEPVVVVLGDNIFSAALGPHVRSWSGRGARLLLSEVPDPGRFGVARFEGERLVEIVEKPAEPPSKLAVTGIYLYDASVYEVIAGLRPSQRGELEITDVNNHFLARGALAWSRLDGWWTDAGTHESLARANRLVGAQ